MTEAATIPARARAPRGDGPVAVAWRRLKKKRLAMTALVILAVLYAAGLFAPLVATHPYTETDLAQTQKPPSGQHWFGTDRLGRDLYSRVLFSMQTTAIITVITVLSGSLILGVSLGLVGGYFRGWIDTVLSRVGELISSFPDILLVLLLAATLRPRFLDIARWVEDTWGIKGIVASGVVDFVMLAVVFLPMSWFGTFRLVRGQVLAVREADYVQAAKATGASTGRILFTHVLPNVIGPIIVSASFSLGSIAGSEAVLSFIGLGVQPPRPSLGTMLSDVNLRSSGAGVSILRDHPEQLIFPALAVWLFIFCWNLLGDALTDVFNPKSR